MSAARDAFAALFSPEHVVRPTRAKDYWKLVLKCRVADIRCRNTRHRHQVIRIAVRRTKVNVRGSSRHFFQAWRKVVRPAGVEPASRG